MCGIIGVTGGSAAVQAYKGLVALQHRGQDSAGIASTAGKRISLIKAPGMVQQVFDDKNLSSLEGDFAVGHVRYATIGGCLHTDSHPFFDVDNRIALAYNGNVVNYDDLSKPFKACLTSTCDAEVLVDMLGRAFASDRSADGVIKGVEEIMEKTNGSYSVVALVSGIGLLAFRDPHAIKPLVMGKREGKNGTEYAFASESVALDTMGFETVRDVKPGEVLIVDLGRKVSSKVIKSAEPAHCMFEWVYFARPDSTMDGKSVYDVRLELGKQLAEQCGKAHGKNRCEGDVVVPVPDTSRTAAQSLSEETGIPCREGLIKNRYVGRTFIMPTQVKRENAVAVKLNPIATVIEGKDVLLVDDSIVRGTTSKKIAGLVKKKAKTVHMLITCPPLKHPCFYGIDFPVRDELIANNRTVEEIRKILELDGLTYMSIDGLKKSIGLPGLCMACLTGQYPTPITKDLEDKVARARVEEREKIGKSS